MKAEREEAVEAEREKSLRTLSPFVAISAVPTRRTRARPGGEDLGEEFLFRIGPNRDRATAAIGASSKPGFAFLPLMRQISVSWGRMNHSPTKRLAKLCQEHLPLRRTMGANTTQVENSPASGPDEESTSALERVRRRYGDNVASFFEKLRSEKNGEASLFD